MPLVNTTPYPGFTGTPTTYQAVILADNPWGYWKLDETDKSEGEFSPNIGSGPASGAVYSGTVANTTKIVSNDEGSAAQLSASNDYMNISSGSFFNNQSFSVEIWMRTSTDSRPLRIFDTRGSGGIGTGTEGIQVAANSSRGWGNTVLEIAGGQHIGGDRPGGWNSRTFDQDDGNPHLVVLTFDNTTGTGTMYFDDAAGLSDTNSNLIGADFSVATYLPSWGRAGDGTQNYIGDTDELAIYDYVLTPAQVLNHYNAGLNL